MRLAKEVAKTEKSGREDYFLENVEKRILIGSNVPQGVHSMASNFWEFGLAPLPWDQLSPDLLTGRGRAVKSMNELRWHPSVEFINTAQKKHRHAIVPYRNWWVMKRWSDGGLGE